MGFKIFPITFFLLFFFLCLTLNQAQENGPLILKTGPFYRANIKMPFLKQSLNGWAAEYLLKEEKILIYLTFRKIEFDASIRKSSERDFDALAAFAYKTKQKNFLIIQKDKFHVFIFEYKINQELPRNLFNQFIKEYFYFRKLYTQSGDIPFPAIIQFANKGGP